MCLIPLEANGASQTSEKTNDSLISKREVTKMEERVKYVVMMYLLATVTSSTLHIYQPMRQVIWILYPMTS